MYYGALFSMIYFLKEQRAGIISARAAPFTIVIANLPIEFSETQQQYPDK